MHVHTITHEDVGKRFMVINGRHIMMCDFMGPPQKRDIGKRIYERDHILSVENDEQLQRRLNQCPDLPRIV